jgi:hypothetical protein
MYIGLGNLNTKMHVYNKCDMQFYYMDNGVLLETKTLVELIRHYIRGQMRVFSVFTPASDIRSSKISRHFHSCCF